MVRGTGRVLPALSTRRVLPTPTPEESTLRPPAPALPAWPHPQPGGCRFLQGLSGRVQDTPTCRSRRPGAVPADTAAAAAARPAGARGHRAQGGLGRSRDRSLSDKDPGRGAGCGGRGLSSESIWRECPCTSKTSLMVVDPSHCLSFPARAPPPQIISNRLLPGPHTPPTRHSVKPCKIWQGLASKVVHLSPAHGH